MSDKFNWPIYGHKNQLKFLQKVIVKDKLANTYLFYGPKGLGKKLTSKYFIKSIFCKDNNTKPCNKCYSCKSLDNNTFLDLYSLGLDKTKLKADDVKEFLHKLSLSNLNGSKKIGIIYNIDYINLFGANALLKTLEETPKDASIILIADSITNIPATIISRSQLVKFKPLELEDMKKWLENFDLEKDEKETILNLSFGRPGIALKLIDDKLANFKKSCSFLLKLLSNSTFYYMQTLDKWFDVLKKEYPEYKVNELGDLTQQYLDILELILRDILWVKIDRPVVNMIYSEQINKLAEDFQIKELINNLLSLNNVKKELKYNISPQLLWENLFLNIK